jgi:hypothetical protein
MAADVLQMAAQAAWSEEMIRAGSSGGRCHDMRGNRVGEWWSRSRGSCGGDMGENPPWRVGPVEGERGYRVGSHASVGWRWVVSWIGLSGSGPLRWKCFQKFKKHFPFNTGRRLNQKKYPEASKKYEILPGSRIVFWRYFDVDNIAWIATDFELKIKTRSELSYPVPRNRERSLHTCAQDVQITRMATIW